MVNHGRLTTERERDIFKNQTTRLWTIAKGLKPYECSANCKAPDDFFTGKPWIKEVDDLEEGQLRFPIACKIWDGTETGSEKNSDDLKWLFNGTLLYQTNDISSYSGTEVSYLVKLFSKVIYYLVKLFSKVV